MCMYNDSFCYTAETDTDESICKAEIETQTQKTSTWTPSGERDAWNEFGDWD